MTYRHAVVACCHVSALQELGVEVLVLVYKSMVRY